MELSKAERAILINQYEILQHVDPDSKDYYQQQIAVLSGGYKVFYEDVVGALDEVDEEVSNFVFDLLNFYRHVRAFTAAHPESPVAQHDWVEFRGFDGNNDDAYYAFTRFLVLEYDKYAELRDVDLNSHATYMLPKYKGMMVKWADFDRSYSLTEEQLLTILDA